LAAVSAAKADGIALVAGAQDGQHEETLRLPAPLANGLAKICV
jgi:hypothetical protein